MARTHILALPWRPAGPHWDWRGRVARVRWWGLLGAAAALIAAARLLAPAALARLDAWLGRDGDSLLLLALLLLAAVAIQGGRRRSSAPAAAPSTVAAEGAAAALAQHLRLEEEIERRLDVVVGDTEQSAVAIMGHVRQLYDQADSVVQYLDRSSTRTGELGQEITDSVASLLDIGAFLERLPAKFERDLRQTQAMARDIVELGGLADAVQAISMQSHILGINAAIEAGHAGESGRSFRIVAQEMRALAANSSAVAGRITKGLTALREGIEDGARNSAAELQRELGAVMASSQAIRELQDNFEDINQFCKTRFAVLTRHNQVQAANIAEVLGQIQYQDVVRQSIERLQRAARQRNEALRHALPPGAAGPDGAALAQALAGVLDGFLAEEARHSHSGRQDSDGDGDGSGLKIELF
jgi:methyl-accepting chemotaxis protein